MNPYQRLLGVIQSNGKLNSYLESSWARRNYTSENAVFVEFYQSNRDDVWEVLGDKARVSRRGLARYVGDLISRYRVARAQDFEHGLGMEAFEIVARWAKPAAKEVQ